MAGVGPRIRTYREGKGYRVKDFASLIGISQGSLSDIENEKTRPSAETLSSLVRNTDIDARWLLTGETAKGHKAQPPEMEKVMAILERGDPGDIGYLRGVIDTEYRKIEEKDRVVKRGA